MSGQAAGKSEKKGYYWIISCLLRYPFSFKKKKFAQKLRKDCRHRESKNAGINYGECEISLEKATLQNNFLKKGLNTFCTVIIPAGTFNNMSFPTLFSTLWFKGFLGFRNFISFLSGVALIVNEKQVYLVQVYFIDSAKIIRNWNFAFSFWMEVHVNSRTFSAVLC